MSFKMSPLEATTGTTITCLRIAIEQANSKKELEAMYTTRRNELFHLMLGSPAVKAFIKHSDDVIFLVDLNFCVYATDTRAEIQALNAVSEVLMARDCFINRHKELKELIDGLTKSQVMVLTAQLFVPDDGNSAIDCSSLPEEIVNWLRARYFNTKLDEILVALGNCVLARMIE